MAAWNLLLTSLALTAACSAPERTAPVAVAIAPMPELSGLTVVEHAGLSHLLAVGDESYELLVMPLPKDALGPPTAGASFTIALPLPRRSGGSELEAVAIAPDGRLAVLSEPGELTFFRLDLAAKTATDPEPLPIVFPPSHPLAAAWDKDPNERAEGLAFLGERVFIAKQTNPAALIELVRVGDTFEAREHWPLDSETQLEDATDLAVLNGSLWVVGGRALAACELGVATAGTPLACKTRLALPDGLEGKKARFEGLALTPSGAFILGADVKKTDRPNLAILPPPR
jgi:hypothetical protein